MEDCLRNSKMHIFGKRGVKEKNIIFIEKIIFSTSLAKNNTNLICRPLKRLFSQGDISSFENLILDERM